MRSLVFLIFLLGLSTASAQLPQRSFVPNAGSPERIFAYTNGQSSFYAGLLQGENSNGFHGITRAKQKLFENYWILLGDSLLDRSTAIVTLTPSGYRRDYPRWNTREDVVFADSLTMLSVRITTDFTGPLAILPGFSPALDQGEAAMFGFTYRISGSTGARVHVKGMSGSWSLPDPRVVEGLRNAGPVFCPAWFDGHPSGGPIEIQIAFPNSSDQISSYQMLNHNEIAAAREARILGRIRSLGYRSSDTLSQESLAWITASLDALIMSQSGAGIYAGLPWFDDYWGRDTFISLPGALLVTGRFEEAKSVLRTFAAFQQKVESDPNFGRIPNRIQPTEIIYNTADGTPWFVIQAWRTVRVSGDLNLARFLYPAIRRAIEGAQRYRMDKDGLLIHADADTWMDAVGPEGPWSPRGNRAVDVQALWVAQLEASAEFARLLSEEKDCKSWTDLARRARNSFREKFVDPSNGVLVDRLTEDGKRDTRSRPNCLFALTIPSTSLVMESTACATLTNVIRTCVYPYGVASLSQNDEDFHPYHTYPSAYPKDAAYHMGTVWTWLSGPAITALCQHDLTDSAWVLWKALEKLERTQAMPGALPECMDALPRDGADLPNWSGTFSQAWSEAEYLRVIHDDFLGLDASALMGDTLRISPRLPRTVDFMEIRTRIGARFCTVRVQREKQNLLALVTPETGKDQLIVLVKGLPAQPAPDGVTTRIQIPSRDLHRCPEPGPVFCTPALARTWKSIAPPAWPLLSSSEVLRSNPAATTLLSSTDAEGDDRGLSNTMTYPRNPLFRSGILDLRKATITTDGSFWYFSISMGALVQPGWHPEYGFQLTYLALVVRTTETPEGAGSNLGHNSGYILPANFGYDRMILVGGGIQVKDRDGSILAAYVPTRPEDAFGDSRTGVIRFALPASLFPMVTSTPACLILSGAQDDHGGAGIGEFREVLLEATEWQGGGGDGIVNVYDEMRL